jgi:hypothetical protein
VAKFDNTKSKELKNYDKRCKELERFQVHMGINSMFEKFNPLLAFYRSLNPKNVAPGLLKNP